MCTPVYVDCLYLLWVVHDYAIQYLREFYVLNYIMRIKNIRTVFDNFVDFKSYFSKYYIYEIYKTTDSFYNFVFKC